MTEDLRAWELDLLTSPEAEVPGTRRPVGQHGAVSEKWDGRAVAIVVSRRGVDTQSRVFADVASACDWLIDRA